MERFHLVGSIVVLCVVAGCGSEAKPSTSASSDEVPSGGMTSFKDVKPILDAKCNGCHSEGGIAPVSLETAGAVAPLAGLIKQKVVSKEMPPWPPDAACSGDLGDRSLSSEQIDIIARWVDEGAAEGDPRDEGPPIQVDPHMGLSRVDLNLSMPLEYTPQQVPDDYRCFVIDWPETEAVYVTGFRANPGNAKVVHHVVAFMAAPGKVADKALGLDAAEPGPGYTCFGASGAGNARTVGGWAPGSRGEDMPPDTGIKVDARLQVDPPDALQ